MLENTNTGARASLYFTPCGWFSSGRYEVPCVSVQHTPALHSGRTVSTRRVAAGLDGGLQGIRLAVKRMLWLQVSGHISTAEGVKVFALGGKWNEYLDAQRCDEEGDPLPDAETLHLWKVRAFLMVAAASFMM